jgi:hypothetical protein
MKMERAQQARTVMRVPRTFGRAHKHLSQPSRPENSFADGATDVHGGPGRVTQEVTETSTHRPWKASVMPVKLPATGVT